MNNSINNNLVLSGEIVSEPVFYHEAYDEKFYTFDLKVKRLSDNYDIVPALISERIIGELKVGMNVTINGQLRTYNKYENNRRRLLIFAFVKDYTVISQEDLDMIKNPNELTIVGYLCKSPVYRQTPLGREICDMHIAINRAYKKSDYIPTIAWGRNAKFCETLKVGTCVQITARVQSREYTKKSDSNEAGETRTAYEVSVNRIKVIENEDEAAFTEE